MRMPIHVSTMETLTISTTINGRLVQDLIEPRMLLIDFLRERVGLTGTKRSCDVQVCGACTVLIDDRPVSSCCTLAYESDGKTVTTIEGLAQAGELDIVQQAFVDTGAIQCGFCTPGMILTTTALLTDSPSPDREMVESWLGGNLCRCTGYWKILDAVELAAQRRNENQEVTS